LSEAGKKELLERWKAGESISDISRALKKPPGSIHGMLKAQGGIAPPHGRSSRFVMLVRLGGKDTESVVAALGEQIRRLPRTMIDTLTWDRGTEMAAPTRASP
jgi:IS30 family transposase